MRIPKKERNDQIRTLRLTDDFWRNVQIVDATEMICLFPKRIDLENAEPGNPENCVYARCVKRVLPNARRVRIWRNVALVETKDSAGQTIAKRYIISRKGKKTLLNFDQGLGEIQPCSLLAPTLSTSLKGKRQRDADPQRQAIKREREKQRRLQKAAGTYKPLTSTKHQGDLFIRNGSGHFKMAL